jgi:hypothetical protein
MPKIHDLARPDALSGRRAVGRVPSGLCYKVAVWLCAAPGMRQGIAAWNAPGGKRRRLARAAVATAKRRRRRDMRNGIEHGTPIAIFDRMGPSGRFDGMANCGSADPAAKARSMSTQRSLDGSTRPG